jgi:hypothetical protein
MSPQLPDVESLTSDQAVTVKSRFPQIVHSYHSDYEPAEYWADKVAHESQKWCGELPSEIFGIIVKLLVLELEQLL